MFSAHN